MMTEQALLKAKVDLYNIVGNYAMAAYKHANYKKGQRISKKHIPYSLCMEGEKAREMYHLVYGKSIEDITLEQEEQIKGYLMRFRIHDTEYLNDLGGKAYYAEDIKQYE
jgi:hypothetical protein